MEGLRFDQYIEAVDSRQFSTCFEMLFIVLSGPARKWLRFCRADASRCLSNTRKNFLYVHANVVVSTDSESVDLNRKILKQLDRYNMKLTLSTQSHDEPVLDEAATALLRIEEVDRRLETIEYRRRYGRTSLTQMRGRKSRDVPVITLRAMLIDLEADKTVYQADYVAQGPWYADTATLVASAVHAFTRQLEQDGFIAVKANAGTNTNRASYVLDVFSIVGLAMDPQWIPDID